MLFDNCVPVLLLLNCILSLCFHILIFACVNVYRIYVRNFHPVYICRNNVSVPTGSRRFSMKMKKVILWCFFGLSLLLL